MKKRIAILVEYFPPRLGGDRRIFELMRRLAFNYDVHFIILPASYTMLIRKIDCLSSEGDFEFVYEGMTGHKLSLPSFILNLWDKGFLQAFPVTIAYLMMKLTRKLGSIKPDVVIINQTSAYTGLLGFLSSKLLNRKLLVEYNDLQALYTFDMVKEKIPLRLHTLVRAVLMTIEDIIVKNGWRVTAITTFIQNYARERRTSLRTEVIPDGVDTTSFDPSKFEREEIRNRFLVDPAEKICLYAGRLEGVAGSGILLDTAKLLEADSTVRFMIVGEGNIELVNQFKNRKNVIYVGRVPKEEVPKYISASDVVLVPFPKGVASHSISPLKLFEALSMGKPVVASNISGIEEVVKDDFYGKLVSDDPNNWASAISVIANDGDRTKLSKRNREIVIEKYDWGSLAKQFSAVIEETD
jgi:glycosyltransferase involved in cell wall biosynthesis